ncbi:MAG: GRAM domain-containing protein [Bacteroidota bacterium]
MKIGYKVNKITWKLRFYLWLAFAVLHSLLLYVFGLLTDGYPSFYNAVLQGVIAGGLFAIIFPYLMKKTVSNLDGGFWKQVKPNLELDEEIKVEGPASLFRGIEGVGGKIYLTNKRLVFNPHRFNFQKKALSLDYNQIDNILTRKTGRLVDNGLSIETKDGNEFRFVVNEREAWLTHMAQIMNINQSQLSTNSI